MAISGAYLAGSAVKGNQPVSYPGSAGDVIYNRFVMSVPASTVVGTTLEIGVIPPNCRVVDMVLESSAVGTSVTGSVGVISDSRTPPAPPGSSSTADLAARTVGTEFFSGTVIAAASATRMSAVTGFGVAPVAYERGIGLVTAGATSAASVQSVVLHAWFAAAA
jgi:hypothetical protein